MTNMRKPISALSFRRVAAGLSQARLADLAGLPGRYAQVRVSEIEHGDPATPEELRKIDEALTRIEAEPLTATGGSR